MNWLIFFGGAAIGGIVSYMIYWMVFKSSSSWSDKYSRTQTLYYLLLITSVWHRREDWFLLFFIPFLCVSTVGMAFAKQTFIRLMTESGEK